MGIYVHIPYCKQACTYCDFYFSTQLNSRWDLLRALGMEVSQRAGELPGPAETLYLGGGTPSILATGEMASTIDLIRYTLGLTKDAEITLEANPDDLTDEKLTAWRNAGVNRLSIGVQTFDDALLRLLNRSHDSRTALAAIRRAQAAGFERLTLDLMFHLPGDTPERLQRDLDTFLELDPGHISAYGLTIEPKTALAHQLATGQLELPPESLFVEQFLHIHEALAAAGYEHYEVSNYARPGQRAVHNTAYWQGKPYLGLGPAAHSYTHNATGTTRRSNHANLHTYTRALLEGGHAPHETETLNLEEQANERIMLGLRWQGGLHLAELEALLGAERYAAWHAQQQAGIAQAVQKGLFLLEDSTLRCTPLGWLQADALSQALFV